MEVSTTKEQIVYTLTCPIDGLIKYVGQTKNLKNRMNKHIAATREGKVAPCQIWIKSLIQQGLLPIMEELVTCCIEDADNEEKFYIALFKQWGFPLTNLQSGGINTKELANETKQKISNSLKGIIQSESTRAKRSATLKITWQSPELRELKRRQTKRLIEMGIIGTKGRPSKKKGLPFMGDKAKLSASLKKHYETHEGWNKFKPVDLQAIIDDYQNKDLRLAEVASKYGVRRTMITKLMKENGIPFRNDGSKHITKEQLLLFRHEYCLSINDIASRMKCSRANVQKFVRLYKIYEIK